VPDYVLRPRGSIVGSTSTTLNWQALPATLPEQYFAGNQARARNVVYDVMLFRAGARGRPVPAELVRSYDGITLPTVRVGPLAACTRYFWTVRARFELDGRMRVSEWSGAYNLGETPDPRSERRGLRGFDDVPVGAFYYWFVTSGFDGIPCPRRA
jgi:hypothetical protein